MFRGINALNLDTKGRLALPARCREVLMAENVSSLVLTIDTDEPCLLLYPADVWQGIEDALQKLPSFNAASRRIQRLLIGHATDLELDVQGRLLLPAILREYAQLDKKVVMIGQGNKFEVWDDALWQNKRAQWLAEEASGQFSLPDEMKTFSL